MSYSILVDTSAFHALQNMGDVEEHEMAKAVAERLQADRALQYSFKTLPERLVRKRRK
jgi:hypothetical protein